MKTSFRTQLNRIIRRTSLQPWLKLFQNLRSTRQTELVQQGWEDHVDGTFIGNTRLVANRNAVLKVAHHYLTNDLSTVSLLEDTDLTSLTGRSMIVTKEEVVPIECVVRGYLADSGWKEY